MGGQNSKVLKNSQIYVKAEAPEYFSGDRVTGKVALILESDLKDPQLFLTLIGKENVRFRSNQAQFLGLNSETRGQEVIISKRIQIPLKVNEKLRAGQYLFPFSVDLPTKLPGTFNSVMGNITYFLGTELLEKGTSQLNYKEELVIRELVKDMKFNLEFSDSKLMRNFFFAEMGMIKMTFMLDKNAVCSGENIGGKLFLDCSGLLLPVNRVVMKVKQETQYSHKGTKGNYDKTIHAQNFDGILPGGVKEYYMSFGIIPTELPTTTGSLISCHYFIKVKAKVKGLRIFNRSPKLKIPFTIFSRPILSQPVQPPPNWNPVEMPAFSGNIEHGIPIQEVYVSDYPQYENQPVQQFHQPLPEAKMQPTNEYFRNYK